MTFGLPNNHKIFVFGVIWGVYGIFGVIWIWSIKTLRKLLLFDLSKAFLKVFGNIWIWCSFQVKKLNKKCLEYTESRYLNQPN